MSMTKPNNATPNRSPKAILSKPVNTADEMAALLVDVSSNPAKIVWPRDAWGFTSPLKKELIKAVSSVKGQEDKFRLLLNTLLVGVKHLQVRFEDGVKEKASRATFLEKAHQERLVRQRFGTAGDKKPAVIEPKSP